MIRRQSTRHTTVQWRELELEVEKAVSVLLRLHVGQMIPGTATNAAVNGAERACILFVMNRYRGNQCKASDAFGVNRNSLRRMLKEYGLSADQFREGVR